MLNKRAEDGGIKMLDGKTILVTGGTGSFGNQFVKYVLRIIILKRLLYIQEMSINSLL